MPLRNRARGNAGKVERNVALDVIVKFISYSSKNDDFARHLHDDLQEAGVRCWFVPEDLKIGDRSHMVIEDAVRLLPHTARWGLNTGRLPCLVRNQDHGSRRC